MEPAIENNVLVVEDDPFWQKVISDNIEKASQNCHISLASSVAEAVAKLESERYSLIVSDYYLEGDKTGYQLWRDCVNHGINVPFLLTSGKVDFPDHAAKNLPVSFLPKSLIDSKLKHRVAYLLDLDGPTRVLNTDRFASLYEYKYKFELLCVALAFALAMMTMQPDKAAAPRVTVLPPLPPVQAIEDAFAAELKQLPPTFRYDREKIFTPDLLAQIELIIQRADEFLAANGSYDVH